jgi:hypothetical protein
MVERGVTTAACLLTVYRQAFQNRHSYDSHPYKVYLELSDKGSYKSSHLSFPPEPFCSFLTLKLFVMRFESLEQDLGCLEIVNVDFHHRATIVLQTFYLSPIEATLVLHGRYSFAENRGEVVPTVHHWYRGRQERQLDS